MIILTFKFGDVEADGDSYLLQISQFDFNIQLWWLELFNFVDILF